MPAGTCPRGRACGAQRESSRAACPWSPRAPLSSRALDPTLRGAIRRRLLLNYRADPTVVSALLPPGMRPKLHDTATIVGICLIRLEDIRPQHAPAWAGLSNQNAAHRFAVEWEADGRVHEGVYIPRRDTGSFVNHLAGGGVFPGEHHQADFEVSDDGGRVALTKRARDDGLTVRAVARAASALSAGSRFASLADASAFFEKGSVGCSSRPTDACLDGIRVPTNDWRVEPVEVEEVRSSYFDDAARFPPGSLELDCGLVMRGITHEWLAESAYVPTR